MWYDLPLPENPVLFQRHFVSRIDGFLMAEGLTEITELFWNGRVWVKHRVYHVKNPVGLKKPYTMPKGTLVGEFERLHWACARLWAQTGLIGLIRRLRKLI